METGEVRIYKDDKLGEFEDSPRHESRTMDCVDCHNRPSHDYLSPQKFVDHSIAAGEISQSIPEIKSVAMGILVREFPTTDSAMKYIETKISDYYNKYYEDFVVENKNLISTAINSIQEGYRNNFFPLMKANYSVYPNHIGHSESPGCYRCHNDSFRSEDGHIISNDCNLCHVIKAQGPAGNMEYTHSDSTLLFNHPMEMTDWQEMPCYECHRELY